MSIHRTLTALALSAAISSASFAAPPADKGGGKGGGGGEDGGGEQAAEVPTTIFIQPSRKGPPSLVVAGANSDAAQTIYSFANVHAYLHDAVLVSAGHGRALITDRSGDPLPLIVVDFWFDDSGLVTSSAAHELTKRADWGCEALSSDGTRAIYSTIGSGVVTEIDIATNTPSILWTMDASQAYWSCDFQSERPLNGTLHAVAYDTLTASYRIDKITLADKAVTTVVSSRPDELRELAVRYSGSSVIAAAFDDPEGVRVGSSFGEAADNEVVVAEGRYPDFYCDGQSMLLRGMDKRKRVTLVHDFQTGSAIYADGYQSYAQTLC